MVVAADEEETDCCICLEEVAQPTVLPCRCKVKYCTACWDRALATSFKTTGWPVCPSCRGAVHVDFDAEAGRLLFSPDPEAADLRATESTLIAGASSVFNQLARDSSVDEGQRLQAEQDARARLREASESARKRQHATVERLLKQAKPAQVKKLEHFGSQFPWLRDLGRRPREALLAWPADELISIAAELAAKAAASPDHAALRPTSSSSAAEVAADSIITAAGAPHRVAGLLVSLHCRGVCSPLCVCGSPLVRVPAIERKRQAFAEMIERYNIPATTVEECFQDALAKKLEIVVCDLCGPGLDDGSCIWNCQNGSSTILHASSYDVCDDCFLQYVCGLEREPKPDGDAAASSSAP